MAVFNSLGSNYGLSFVWKNLFAKGSKTAAEELKNLLQKKYGGQVTLTYKGREALELAFKKSGLPGGSQIGVNGFTCYVVYQAVVNAGYQPLFIDITPGQTNFGPTELKHAKTKNPNLRAIIMQNTLGYPAEMQAIMYYCQQQGIMIVEDLAHSTGALYDTGHEAGMVGSFTMLSFSRDKTLDAVAGGALIDRRQNQAGADMVLPYINWSQRTNNRLYPFWTTIVRATYPIGLGRIIHAILRKLKLLNSPMEDTRTGLHQMTKTAPALILDKWQHERDELAHRQQIALIYMQNLPADIQLVKKQSGKPTFLRFPLFVDNPASLFEYLKKHHIFISDIWYDATIAPKRYLPQTNYKAGSCPNGEELVKHIVNLPTHIHITPEIATKICERINQWLTLQPKK